MKTAVYQAALTCIAFAVCAVFALAGDKLRTEALYDIALDIDHDGKMDRAVLVLVGPGRTDFHPLTAERYGLSEDESVDLYLYLGAGDEQIDLARKPSFVRKAIVDTKETSWVQPLERNGGGSLLVTSVYGWGARQSWGETLTVAYRKGEFLVAGYSRGWEWGNEVRKPDGGWDVETIIGGCDINFLSGKGVVSEGLDESKPIKGKFTPIKLADWSTADRPEACEF